MRLTPIHCALVFVSMVLAACVQHGCPEGTKDLAGGCVDPSLQRNAKDAGEQARSGIEANGAAGTAPTHERKDEGVTHDAAGSGDPATNAPSDAGMAAEPMTTDASAPDDAVVADAATTEPNEPTCDGVTCGANAHCALANLTGAPGCFCDIGYEGDARAGCTDIDECATDTDDCSEFATCTNVPGTRACTCNPGSEGDGVTCMANPCEPRVNPCDAETTTCRDAGGKAVCDCIANHDRCDSDPYACNTDLTNDRYNCGQCNFTCAGKLACVDSTCEQSATALSLGADHSCALRANGEVWCWGGNTYLQLGDQAPTASHPTPVKAAIASVVHLDAGQSRTCAVSSDDRLECWGMTQLILGMSSTSDSSGFFDVGTTSKVLRDLSVGGSAACTLVPSGSECWGYDLDNSLGKAPTTGSALRGYSLRLGVSLTDPIDIDVGARMACVLTGGGHVTCWGGAANPEVHVIEKANGAPLGDVKGMSVSLGENGSYPVDSACAVTSTGNIWCWGTNAQGELGNPAFTDDYSAGAIEVTDSTGAPAEHVVEVAVGAYHACARADTGAVFCWGRTDLTGSGRAGTAIRRSPVEVKDLTDAIELKAGTLHTCARRRTGQVVCWGNNASGQLGVDPTTTPTSNVPVNVTNLP